MNKFYITLLSIFFSATLISSAGETDSPHKTLFGGNKFSIGGWGALDIKGGQSFNNEFGMLIGGKGGVLLDHRLTIGLAGYGLVPFQKLDAPRNIYNEKPYLNFSYGGLYLEYTVLPFEVFHFSASCIIGGGGAGYAYPRYNDDIDFDEDWHYSFDPIDANPLFVIEPGINLEINVSKYMRMNIGASYRHISAFEEPINDLKNTDLGGLNGNITFKFGKF